MRVRFTAAYNHRWPSRAATFFPAGYEGTVRRVVGEGAIVKGRATETVNPATAPGNAFARPQRIDAVVREDSRPAVARHQRRVTGGHSRDGDRAYRAAVGTADGVAGQ